MIKQLKKFARIVRVTGIRKTIHLSRRIYLPGFEGVSLWEVLFFFVWSLRKGLISTKAAALSFHFFLAMIPFGLLLVTLSAFLPVYDIERDVIPILANFIPPQLATNLIESINEFEKSSVTSLVSFGFVFALYFASNGFSVLLNTFNNSQQKFEKRGWWSVKLLSIGFVILFLIGLFSVFFILVVEKKLLNSWADEVEFVEKNYALFFTIINSLFFAVMLYFSIAIVYYLGPLRRQGFRFFSAGATLSTLLIILISIAYVYYVSAFAKYNEIYGSIGTIMILLLWIYFVSFSLLIGFELNASIHGAATKKSLDNLQIIEKRQEDVY